MNFSLILRQKRTKEAVASGLVAKEWTKVAQLRESEEAQERAHAELLALRLQIIEAAAKEDDAEVTRLSILLSGYDIRGTAWFEERLAALAKREEQTHRHTPRVDGEKLTRWAKKTLQHYGFAHVTLRASKRARARLTWNAAGEGSFRIPEHALLTRRRARRLIAHELEVHALRTHNARNISPILLLPTIGSRATEEGLALVHEQRALPSPALPPGFWDAYSAALLFERGKTEAIATLSPYKSPEKIKKLLRRYKRGIKHFGAPGIGFFVDHAYLLGAEDVAAADSDTYHQLFAGKFALRDLTNVEHLIANATWRTPDMEWAKNLGKKQKHLP